MSAVEDVADPVTIAKAASIGAAYKSGPDLFHVDAVFKLLGHMGVFISIEQWRDLKVSCGCLEIFPSQPAGPAQAQPAVLADSAELQVEDLKRQLKRSAFKLSVMSLIHESCLNICSLCDPLLICDD